MRLVATRQQLQQEEIAVIRSSLQKRLALLQKYAALAQSLAPAELPKLRSSLQQLLEPLYEEAEALYGLLKTSGLKEEGGEDPESEVKRLLSAVFQLFEHSELFAELRAAVTARLYALFEKQHRQLSRAKRPFAARPSGAKRRRAALYQIDNRPRRLRVAQLPAGATQDDVAGALKGFFGVQRIDVQAGSATIDFQQPWQTAKPLRKGLWIRNQVLLDASLLSRKSSPSSFPPPLLTLPRSPPRRRSPRRRPDLPSRRRRRSRPDLPNLLSLPNPPNPLDPPNPPDLWNLLRPHSLRMKRPLPPVLLVFAVCVGQTTLNQTPLK